MEVYGKAYIDNKCIIFSDGSVGISFHSLPLACK